MTKIPISICFFTTTRGHYNNKSMYLDTLNHLNKQISLYDFGARYAHIKVTPGEEEISKNMRAELEKRGFVVEETLGDWSRGTSHQQAYLIDMRKASQSLVIQSQPYMLLLEDDSPFTCHEEELAQCLSRMIYTLENDPNTVSCRFIRKGDYDGGIPMFAPKLKYFSSPNFDFQPAILRSRDYLIANKIIEDNWSSLSHLQCELIMRIALDTLSRSEYKHLVWRPEYGETYHLGTPDYESVKKSIGLY